MVAAGILWRTSDTRGESRSPESGRMEERVLVSGALLEVLSHDSRVTRHEPQARRVSGASGHTALAPDLHPPWYVLSLCPCFYRSNVSSTT